MCQRRQNSLILAEENGASKFPATLYQKVTQCRLQYQLSPKISIELYWIGITRDQIRYSGGRVQVLIAVIDQQSKVVRNEGLFE